MSVICSGSLAFDRLMSYPGVFSDSILADKLDMLNVCFVTDKVELVHGGTAGNIAYNLTLLNEKPIIIASLGADPDGRDYTRRIEEWGLPFEAIKTQAGTVTAGCTIVTDQNGNQLTFFNAGAMSVPTGYNPAGLPQPYDQHLAIVSPGGFEEMKSLCAVYRRIGLKFIFDPGQQIPVFSKEDLVGMLEGSSIFICNEYEFELFKQNSGLSTEDLFKYTETVIVTKGENGSELLVPGRGSQHVPPVPVGRAANPTGAGDAFRAGLMAGLYHRHSLITSCRLGSTVAAFCVETEGGPQKQSFSVGDVMARHAGAFKEQVSL